MGVDVVAVTAESEQAFARKMRFSEANAEQQITATHATEMMTASGWHT